MRNCGKKMPRTRKYEGKRPVMRWPITSIAVRDECVAISFSGGFLPLLILAGKSFSEMFTTYSHALCSLPRQRASD
jgi:hypothetical protein